MENTIKMQENKKSRNARGIFNTGMKSPVQFKCRVISLFYDMMKSIVCFLTIMGRYLGKVVTIHCTYFEIFP